MLVRDFESSFLTLDPAAVSGFDDLLGHSITYRTQHLQIRTEGDWIPVRERSVYRRKGK